MKSNFACFALAIAIQTQTAHAQGDLLGADEVAEAIVAMTTRVWTGPRTPAPPRTQRPTDASFTIRSTHSLVAVHAGPEAHPAMMHRVLQALEHARSRLGLMGWPAPISDGGLGDGPGLDLYLTPAAPPTGAYSDGLTPWTYLDRASTFAVLNPVTSAHALDACVTMAYAEALLLSMDPAEARTWRRATAAWLAWELTGRFGCEDSVVQQQAEPFRSWVVGGADEGAGGALLLAYLSARHDGGTGRFIREVWELASQRTWEGAELRADPDIWSAIETAVERSGDRLLDNIEDLAVLRSFAGRATSKSSLVASLDDDARASISRRLKRPPTQVTAGRPLQAFGSAYMALEAPALQGTTYLRAWLRGEYGVHWSFVAVELDENGVEQSRIAAPHTGRSPDAYLPIELDDATHRVLFVITNLSSRLPDADEPDANERSFQLIVDRSDD